MRVRMRYQGRVQGVGFRMTALSIATRHAVSGWVRNEADGSVLLQVEGGSAEVEGYLSDLAASMGRNIVQATRTDLGSWEIDEAGLGGFEIRH
ncbi:MAG: acylphosphatase [Phycisphaerales bacterium]|nr:acylphosphatase [Phycisphaerales bacterium]